jgi:hypothetical protein
VVSSQEKSGPGELNPRPQQCQRTSSKDYNIIDGS